MTLLLASSSPTSRADGAEPPREAERLVTHVASFAGAAVEVALATLSTTDRLRIVADTETVTSGPRRENVRAAARQALQLGHTGHWLSSADRTSAQFVASPAPGVTLILVATFDHPGDVSDALQRLEASTGLIEDFVAMWWRSERSQARCAGLRAAFGTLESGGILLDGHGNVIETNRAARAVLNRRDALLLNGTRLGAVDPDDEALLRRTIMKFAVASRVDPQAQPHHLLIRREDGMRPVSVAVLCTGSLGPAARLDGDPAVLLLLADAETSSASVSTACQAYGLSKSEAMLADHLVAGLSIEEIATAMALKPDSIRTYLKHIFGKTGVSRQSTLVRLLLHSRLPIDGFQTTSLLNRYRRPASDRRRRPATAIA